MRTHHIDRVNSQGKHVPVSKQVKQAGVQDLQHQLLLAVGAIVPFVGTISGQQLRIRWTTAMRELFGIEDGQASWRGGPLFNAQVDKDDGITLRTAVTQLIKNGEAMDILYRVGNGNDQRCLQVRAVLQPEAGKPRVIGVFRNCTMNAVAERQLQTTQERLQSVGRLTLLGEVASGLAHELNQPLAAITTFAQAGERLLGLPEPRLEKAQQVFREVTQQALRAGEIIRHMRSLIKRRAYQVESVSCSTLMRDFLAMAEPMARAAQVQLVVRLEAADKTLLIDASQIHQAMMILFQNALDATRERASDSAGRVQVELLAREYGVEYGIEDQGAGVSETVARQLFKPFFSTKESGTGLGLISCRNILDSYGGRLAYTNLPGGGCRFWFALPYASAGHKPQSGTAATRV
jgi:two-component system, LuxR family, sensor kinase FixL